MQHVRVGDDQVAPRADGLASVLRRIAVVSERANFLAELFGPAIEFDELILREGFGGEEIKGARLGVLNEFAQDRQVVT